MGSSSSKVARGAVSGAARKYPAKASEAATARASPKRKPRTAPADGVAEDKDAIIAKMDEMNAHPDFSSADFSRRLHEMGIVQPNPTFSPSSTASPNLSPESAIAPLGPLFPSAKHNTTLSVLDARRRLEQQANQDFEAIGRGLPRRFVDVGILAQAMELRDGGMRTADIEKRLGLKAGLLDKLGPPGILTYVE